MPKKPIKRGFKMYSLSCACCGYLCDFRLCAGKEVDPVNGKRLDKPVKVADTVKDLLVSVYSGHNHVVYMDRHFTNGPTVSELQQVGIFTVGTIQRSAAGFPPELKSIDPPAGVYCAALHNGLHYYVFNDRSIVCFVSSVFPLHTEPMWRKAKGSKGGCMTKTDSVPPVVPVYNHYMGGVDRTNHMCQTYLLDHRCIRPWMRIFLQLFQLAVMNASLLHSHSCKSNLQFRQELVELCLQGYCGRERKRSPVPLQVAPSAALKRTMSWSAYGTSLLRGVGALAVTLTRHLAASAAKSDCASCFAFKNIIQVVYRPLACCVPMGSILWHASVGVVGGVSGCGLGRVGMVWSAWE